MNLLVICGSGRSIVAPEVTLGSGGFSNIPSLTDNLFLFRVNLSDLSGSLTVAKFSSLSLVLSSISGLLLLFLPLCLLSALS